MSKMKDFFTKMARAPRDIFNVLSGKAARDAEKMKQEIKRINEENRGILEQVDDLMAFERFRARMAGKYFTCLAKAQPEMAHEYNDLAALAARVDTSRLRGDASAYQQGEEEAQRWHLVRERYHDEISRFAARHIESFIKEDPERWARMEKHAPKLAKTMKPQP